MAGKASSGYFPEWKDFLEVLDPFLGHDRLAAPKLHRHVLEVRMDRNGNVRRKRPGSSGPNEKIRPVERRHRESEIDRRRGQVLVLQLRLGQRGAVLEAPVDGAP